MCLIWTPALVVDSIGSAADLVGSARHRQLSGPRRIAACKAVATSLRRLVPYVRFREALRRSLPTAPSCNRSFRQHPQAGDLIGLAQRCARSWRLRLTSTNPSDSAIDRPRGPSIFSAFHEDDQKWWGGVLIIFARRGDPNVQVFLDRWRDRAIADDDNRLCDVHVAATRRSVEVGLLSGNATGRALTSSHKCY